MHLFFLSVHHQVDNRNDETVQESGSQQSAQNDFCHGTLYFITGQVAAERQRNQCKRTGQCRHQDRIQTVQRTAYHAVVHTVSLFLLQVVVMTDEQHTVSGGDTEERDKADDSRNTDFARCDEQGEYTSNQCQRQVDKDNRTFLYITTIDMNEVKASVRLAACSLSNWPPYSM